jgi:hypothetical protein
MMAQSKQTPLLTNTEGELISQTHVLVVESHLYPSIQEQPIETILEPVKGILLQLTQVAIEPPVYPKLKSH